VHEYPGLEVEPDLNLGLTRCVRLKAVVVSRASVLMKASTNAD
jgi:hypothetical protein